MSKHTPEKWRVKTLSERRKCEFGMIIAKTMSGDYYIGHAMDWGPTNDKANADRIVACINNCAGINPDGVPDAVAALRYALNWFESDQSMQLGRTMQVIDAARAALAKLEATNDLQAN